MAKKKSAPKKKLKSRLTLINLKVTETERKMLMEMAKHFTGGNLSSWLRYAGVHHVPHWVDGHPLKRA